MEAEVTDLAGVKGRHDTDHTHTRHGTEHGSVTLSAPCLWIEAVRLRRPLTGERWAAGLCVTTTTGPVNSAGDDVAAVR